MIAVVLNNINNNNRNDNVNDVGKHRQRVHIWNGWHECETHKLRNHIDDGKVSTILTNSIKIYHKYVKMYIYVFPLWTKIEFRIECQCTRIHYKVAYMYVCVGLFLFYQSKRRDDKRNANMTKYKKAPLDKIKYMYVNEERKRNGMWLMSVEIWEIVYVKVFLLLKIAIRQ